MKGIEKILADWFDCTDFRRPWALVLPTMKRTRTLQKPPAPAQVKPRVGTCTDCRRCQFGKCYGRRVDSSL
jgi:hypothetical protein